VRHVLLTLTLLLAAPLADATQFGNGPIQPVDAPATSAGAPEGTAVRVDTDSLGANQAGDQVWLPGSHGKAVPARVTRVVRRPDGGLAWTARVPAAGGEQTATIVEKNGHVFGLIPQSDGPALRLETRHGQSRIVADKPFDPPAGPDVLLPPEPTPAQRALRKRQESNKADGTPRIDVLVAYQPSLVEVWGSVAAVQARIAYLETITNQAYVDTGMDLEIRVVATHLLDFAADADNVDALYAITNTSNLAVKQEIDRVRAMYGADLVKLMRNFDRVNQTSCGVGWLGGYHGNPFVPGYGFSVTADLGFGGDGCGEWTFAHELGHNQGAHHDIETTNGDYGAFEYSRGHRQTISADSGFATIMAYNTGPQNRLGRFSDPDLLECLGQPCGIADEADNARGIAETAALVAGLLPEASANGLPTLSLDDVQIVEGNSGQRPLRFTLSLSGAAAGPVTVNLATRQASATVADFVSRSYNILIPAGQTAVTIDVGVRGDTLVEPDEVFSLDILSASGAGIAKGQGVATIVSDDPVPTLSIADLEIEEGNDGAREAVLTAILSQASNQPVRFDVETGSSSASASSDFVYANLQDLEIPAGVTSLQFTVTVLGDTQDEANERFYVALGGLSGARVDDSIAWVTILNDDAANPPARPLLSVEPLSVAEGSAGRQPVNVRVVLEAAAGQDVTFALLAQGVTATAGVDFDASGLAGLRIPSGQTSVQVPLVVVGDTLDEADETLVLRLGNVVGATPSAEAALVILRDDDGAAQTSPLVARDDRVVLLENAGASEINVLANDVFASAGLQGGSLVIVEMPVYGTVQVDTNATSGTVADDTLVYTPPADAFVEDLLAYRLCDAGGRCSEALLRVLVRPSLGVEVDSPDASGFVDVNLSGLRAYSDLRVRGYGLAYWANEELVELAGDTTPESPWDGQGTQEFIWTLQNVYIPGGSLEPYVDYRLFPEAEALQGGDVDLYIGLDDNGNGRADPGETRCVAAMGDAIERCEQNLRLPFNGERTHWALLHNRAPTPTSARLQVFATGVDDLLEGSEDLVATAPGKLAAGEHFPVRVSWHLPVVGRDQNVLALVALEEAATGALSWFPVRIALGNQLWAPAMPQLDTWFGTYRNIPPDTVDDRLFIDLPEGVDSLEVRIGVYGGAVDVHLANVAPDYRSARVGPAPPSSAAQHSFPDVSSATISLGPLDLAPGRWYVILDNNSQASVEVSLSASIQAQAPPLTPGSYFNPDRSGHGLFLYPAGDTVAGLWYTYLQDGTPTWYYLQAAQPGTSGQWVAPLYRAVWNGSSNTLTQVGQAAATVQEDGLIFSYRLDGETGSEKLVPLGSGCPSLGGQPLDASSHWFDPAKAGTGYSVQLFPDYEFYAAFVSARGGVRCFLPAVAGSFRGADTTLPLEQLTGFCPLCERTGAPTRADIGTLRRRFDANGLVQMQLDAIYTGGVPGAWTGNDSVQLLGGAGTTQGCPAP